jgi:hypothetical protein
VVDIGYWIDTKKGRRFGRSLEMQCILRCVYADISFSKIKKRYRLHWIIKINLYMNKESKKIYVYVLESLSAFAYMLWSFAVVFVDLSVTLDYTWNLCGFSNCRCLVLRLAVTLYVRSFCFSTFINSKLSFTMKYLVGFHPFQFFHYSQHY